MNDEKTFRIEIDFWNVPNSLFVESIMTDIESVIDKRLAKDRWEMGLVDLKVKKNEHPG